MVPNTAMTEETGLPSVFAVIDACRTALAMWRDFTTVCNSQNATPRYRRPLRSVQVLFLHFNIHTKERWDAAVRRGHGSLAKRSLLDA